MRHGSKGQYRFDGLVVPSVLFDESQHALFFGHGRKGSGDSNVQPTTCTLDLASVRAVCRCPHISHHIVHHLRAWLQAAVRDVHARQERAGTTYEPLASRSAACLIG